jgi:pimeloyl-ACP methyl ester carboxylesterase
MVNSTDDALGFVRESGLFGRAVVPTGLYAYHPSGMEVGGTTWYRMLPGFEGTDPISMTTAILQLCDLLDDVELEQPVLVGWGQGALVALAAGMLRPDAVGSVACCDTPIAHVRLLPTAVLDAPARPNLLLAATGVHRRTELEEVERLLSGHKIAATTWCWPGEGTQADLDRALAGRIGRWMDHE